MEQPTLFDRMRSEHRGLLARLDGLGARMEREREPDGPLPAETRAELRRLGDALRRHLDLEDEAIYTTLARLLPETAPQFSALRRQRSDLRGMVASLEAELDAAPSPERDEQIVVEATDLFEMVRIHVRKEEALVFGLAEHALSPDALAALRVPPPAAGSGPAAGAREPLPGKGPSA